MSQASASEALVDLNENLCLTLVREEVDAGREPRAILEELQQGMVEVGNRFEKSEYFISELIMAAEIFKECMALLEPRLKSGAAFALGSVLIGTVQGDVHDLGKNIVASVLMGSGFAVNDLGVDVPPERFVEKARELHPDIIGLSALITTSIESMKTTIALLHAAGIHSKIMVGGGIVSHDEKVRDYVGADAVGRDAIEAVHLAKGFLRKG